VTACIGEPISWLRLEAFALGAPDPAVPLHTAACPVCRRCLDQIRDDVVALPPLELPLPRPARRWWARPGTPARRRWWPSLALAAAALAALAVLAVVVIAPGESSPPESRASQGDSLGVVAVKGVGDVRLELVRERAGEIRHEASRFARGDRWKVVVTCAPSATAWVEVSVSDGATIDHPIAPARLPCGNRIVVPGAFTITGIGANQVCVRVAAGPGAPSAIACATVRPE